MFRTGMFRSELKLLADRSLLRRLSRLESGTGPIIQYAGREVILLSSNDYLGLATHPEVIRAAMQATEQYGAGSGASRSVSGTLSPHMDLETSLATFKGTEAAILFGAGYLANIGVIPTFIGPGGLILADRLCHASLIDGCRLSQAVIATVNTWSYCFGDGELAVPRSSSQKGYSAWMATSLPYRIWSR
jgi:glycine C-acetyltransferase/8-amino-7-oxononanoate synthase